MFESISIDSLSFHESIVAPAFQDIIPQGYPYTGTLNEFTLMDNVSSKRPIIDIKRVQNILQRRDASCDITYKKVFGASTRSVTTEEIYGATQFCRNEFYQGALKDWRNGDPLFIDKILPFFQGAISIDLASNSYFGDVDRVVATSAVWSTAVFDGVFKWIKAYQTAGVIPASQSIAIADGTDYLANASAAYNLIKAMYDKQNPLMKSFGPTEKAFYVSREIADGYEDYLTAAGVTNGFVNDLVTGKRYAAYKGIPILVEEIWTPILTELKGGTAGFAAVLTLRGNFVLATDSAYGEGEDGKTALEVWYEKKDMQFYYRIFMKAGTQIALPEHLVYALSNFS
jgi:hypothetical protein